MLLKRPRTVVIIMSFATLEPVPQWSRKKKIAGFHSDPGDHKLPREVRQHVKRFGAGHEGQVLDRGGQIFFANCSS